MIEWEDELLFPGDGLGSETVGEGVEQGLMSRMNDDRCDYVPPLCFAIMCCSKGG